MKKHVIRQAHWEANALIQLRLPALSRIELHNFAPRLHAAHNRQPGP